MLRTMLAAFAVCAVATVDAFVPSAPLLAVPRAGAAPALRGVPAVGRARAAARASLRGVRGGPLQLQALFGIGENIKKVGVVGATGGVGRLAVAYLLEKGYTVRAIVRSEDRAKELLPADIELKLGDTCDPAFGDGLTAAIAGVDALIVASGTTAFPTDKWGPNQEYTPQAVDEKGVKNVVAAISEVNSKGKKVKKIALLSSIGVERSTQFPFSLLNFYGVLDAKKAGEVAVKEGAASAGYTYSLARLGRLVGGPYTGTPDVASLLQLDEGGNQAITMRKGDPKGFAGDLSRKQAAAALVQSLMTDKSNLEFAIVNKPGPEPSQNEWTAAFEGLDNEVEEEEKDFSFLISDLVNKASKTWEETKEKANAQMLDYSSSVEELFDMDNMTATATAKYEDFLAKTSDKWQSVKETASARIASLSSEIENLSSQATEQVEASKTEAQNNIVSFTSPKIKEVRSKIESFMSGMSSQVKTSIGASSESKEEEEKK